MSIAGNLKTMQLAELLQWLSSSAKTGALVINNGEVEKKIWFSMGRIYSSASTDPKEYLGHFLVSHGFINELELTKAIEMQESNKMLLGKILVTIGAVSEPDLQRLLRLKAEEAIYDLFSWEEGDFRFLEGDQPSGHLVPIDLDATAIILEGARRADEWRRIREVIPSMKVIPVWIGDLTDPGIDPGARQILALVDDDRTIDEICADSHATEFRVCRILYSQYENGRVKLVRPRGTAVEGGGEQEEKPPLALQLASEAERAMIRQDYDEAQRCFRAARIMAPDNKRIEKACNQATEKIKAAVSAEGVVLDAVPKLAVEMSEITHLDLSPQEGFLLTRIDGSNNLKQLLRISSVQPLEGLVQFWKLYKAGHITME